MDFYDINITHSLTKNQKDLISSVIANSNKAAMQALFAMRNSAARTDYIYSLNNNNPIVDICLWRGADLHLSSNRYLPTSAGKTLQMGGLYKDHSSSAGWEYNQPPDASKFFKTIDLTNTTTKINALVVSALMYSPNPSSVSPSVDITLSGTDHSSTFPLQNQPLDTLIDVSNLSSDAGDYKLRLSINVTRGVTGTNYRCWSARTNRPAAAENAGAAPLSGDRVVSFPGDDNVGNSDVRRFAESTNAWTTRTSFPGLILGNMANAVSGNNILVTGGVYGGSLTIATLSITFSDSGNFYQNNQIFSFGVRDAGNFTAGTDTAIIAGGENQISTDPRKISGCDSVLKYWRDLYLITSGYGTNSPSSWGLGSNIGILAGGRNSLGGIGQPTYSNNIALRSAESKTDKPIVGAWSRGFSINSTTGLSCGGNSSITKSPAGITNACYWYNYSGDSWNATTSMPQQKMYGGTASLCGERGLYIGGVGTVAGEGIDNYRYSHGDGHICGYAVHIF